MTDYANQAFRTQNKLFSIPPLAYINFIYISESTEQRKKPLKSLAASSSTKQNIISYFYVMYFSKALVLNYFKFAVGLYQHFTSTFQSYTNSTFQSTGRKSIGFVLVTFIHWIFSLIFSSTSKSKYLKVFSFCHH